MTQTAVETAVPMTCQDGHQRPILGIETSCDETAAAVYGADGLLSNVVASQLDAHRAFGGVVPELASRMHLEAISPVIQTALGEAGLTPEDLGAVAVTNGPGLVGSLLVGVCAAKGFCLAHGLPLVAVNHLVGHIYSAWLEEPYPAFPALVLIASGGHSDLIAMRRHGDFRVLGRTRDDAAGEALDKVGRLLSLPYPGGPRIDQLAETGDPTRYPLPRARLDGQPEFSFSGLKTAVARLVEDWTDDELARNQADLCASFRQAVIDVLCEKAGEAAQTERAASLILCGGVAASRGLRRGMQATADSLGLPLHIPAFAYCTDNAAMIACAGWHRWQAGVTDGLGLEVGSSLPIDSLAGSD